MARIRVYNSNGGKGKGFEMDLEVPYETWERAGNCNSYLGCKEGGGGGGGGGGEVCFSNPLPLEQASFHAQHFKISV